MTISNVRARQTARETLASLDRHLLGCRIMPESTVHVEHACQDVERLRRAVQEIEATLPEDVRAYYEWMRANAERKA